MISVFSSLKIILLKTFFAKEAIVKPKIYKYVYNHFLLLQKKKKVIKIHSTFIVKRGQVYNCLNKLLKKDYQKSMATFVLNRQLPKNCSVIQRNRLK